MEGYKPRDLRASHTLVVYYESIAGGSVRSQEPCSRGCERHAPGTSASGDPDPRRTETSVRQASVNQLRRFTSNGVQSCVPGPTTTLHQYVITQMRINNIYPNRHITDI
jgi:hypothetical protein